MYKRQHVGEPLTSVAEAPEGNQVAIDGTTVTFSADTPVGAKYVAYYIETLDSVKTIEINSDNFPESFRIVADALIREKETGKDDFIQIEYVNARPQSNFTITMSTTDPTTLEVTFDLFPNKDKNIAVYKIIED